MNNILFHNFCVYSQYHVVLQATYQMDREATPGPLLGARSLTPVIQGTVGFQVVLVEHVNQITSGQGVIQHVHVSLHIVAVVWTITPCKLARN